MLYITHRMTSYISYTLHCMNIRIIPCIAYIVACMRYAVHHTRDDLVHCMYSVEIETTIGMHCIPRMWLSSLQCTYLMLWVNMCLASWASVPCSCIPSCMNRHALKDACTHTCTANASVLLKVSDATMQYTLYGTMCMRCRPLIHNPIMSCGLSYSV